MIKTTRYCDICGREQFSSSLFYDNFYQTFLPEPNYDGEIGLSEDKKDICKSCLKKLHWKIGEIKYPNRKCPD